MKSPQRLILGTLANCGGEESLRPQPARARDREAAGERDAFETNWAGVGHCLRYRKNPCRAYREEDRDALGHRCPQPRARLGTRGSGSKPDRMFAHRRGERQAHSVKDCGCPGCPQRQTAGSRSSQRRGRPPIRNLLDRPPGKQVTKLRAPDHKCFFKKAFQFQAPTDRIKSPRRNHPSKLWAREICKRPSPGVCIRGLDKNREELSYSRFALLRPKREEAAGTTVIPLFTADLGNSQDRTSSEIIRSLNIK